MATQAGTFQAIQHEGEPRANAIRERLNAVVGRGQRTYTPSQLTVEKAEGCTLWTVDGRRLLDFTSGVLVTNLGMAIPGLRNGIANTPGHCRATPTTW